MADATNLVSLVAKVNKELGEGTLISGSELKDLKIPRCPSGSLSLDMMLGGGWPMNCWSEIVGEPSNGKSVIALKTLAANQAADPKFEALWVASEDFVPQWAIACGVDLDRVTLARTVIMEEAYQIIIEALDYRMVDCVIVDSLSALTPQDEEQKTMDEWAVGLGARLTNKFMRKSGKAQRRSLTEEDRNCLGIIISQWRQNIGVQWGDNRTTPYGRGKEFHYMVRVEVKRDEWLNIKDDKVGLSFKARTVKNKTAPPQRLATVDFYWQDVPGFKGGEYDTLKEAMAIAIVEGVIERKGAWFFYGEEKWNGKDAVLLGLREDRMLQQQLVNEIRVRAGYDPLPVSGMAKVRRRVKKGTA